MTEHLDHYKNIENYDTKNIINQSENLLPFLQLLKDMSLEQIKLTQQESLKKIDQLKKEYDLKVEKEKDDTDLKI